MSDWRNLTISVRWETYYYAREWAAQQDMSISAVVARFLENLPYNSKYEVPPPRKRTDPDPLTLHTNLGGKPPNLASSKPATPST